MRGDCRTGAAPKRLEGWGGFARRVARAGRTWNNERRRRRRAVIVKGTLGRASDYASHCKSSVLNYFSYYALETIVWGARVIIINRNDYFAEVDRQRRNVITADALYAISEGSTEDFKKGNS